MSSPRQAAPADRFEELLNRYIDGTLTASETRQLNAWLAESPERRAQLTQLTQANRALQADRATLTRLAPEPPAHADIMAMLKARQKRGWSLRILPVVGMVVATFLIFGFIIQIVLQATASPTDRGWSPVATITSAPTVTPTISDTPAPSPTSTPPSTTAPATTYAPIVINFPTAAVTPQITTVTTVPVTPVKTNPATAIAPTATPTPPAATRLNDNPHSYLNDWARDNSALLYSDDGYKKDGTRGQPGIWRISTANLGKDIFLGEGSDAKYSPDGQSIAFRVGGELWLMNAAGQAESRRKLVGDLFSDDKGRPGWWQWLSDGRLAYQAQQSGATYGYVIRVFNPTNGTSPKIDLPNGAATYGHLAPDGTLITSSEKESFSLVRVVASSALPSANILAQLTEGTGGQSAYVEAAAWSPDSRSLAVKLRTEVALANNAGFRSVYYLKVVTIEDMQKLSVRVTSLASYGNGDKATENFEPFGFAWSPDSRKVAIIEAQYTDKGYPTTTKAQARIFDLAKATNTTLAMPLEGVPVSLRFLTNETYLLFAPSGKYLVSSGTSYLSGGGGYIAPDRASYIYQYNLPYK